MSADQVVVRPTRLSDCAQLAPIEQSAAVAFRSDPALAWLADGDLIPAERHADLLTRGISYVATAPGNRLLGFITTERFGLDLHVWELSVHADWQQSGIGRRLLVEAEQSAKLSGMQRMTLTTFRDLAWNGPFYARCGYRDLADPILEPRLAALLAAERQNGLPVKRRCAMIKPL